MMDEPQMINICANSSCEWPIYKGDQAWKLGNDLFCHIECAMGVLKGI